MISVDGEADPISEARTAAFSKQGFRQLGDDVAILTYRASAKRANGEPYRALVSSAYTKRGGSWKMAFHQQTPLQAG